MPAVAAERVAEVFVEVADTLVEDFDLIDFLIRLADRATELCSATAAGLLLADIGGRLRFMAASDERTHLLELFQLQADEGPCRDCFRGGEPVSHSDLASAADRWPAFAPVAVEAGFRVVNAFPLRLRGQIIGALGVFNEGQQIDAGAARIVQALADVATIALLQERAIHHGEVLTEQLQGALNSRIVIEQAKGVIAHHHSIPVDEAFTLLREHVRRHGLRLTDVARSIANHPGTPPNLTASQKATAPPTDTEIDGSRSGSSTRTTTSTNQHRNQTGC